MLVLWGLILVVCNFYLLFSLSPPFMLFLIRRRWRWVALYLFLLRTETNMVSLPCCWAVPLCTWLAKSFSRQIRSCLEILLCSGPCVEISLSSARASTGLKSTSRFLRLLEDSHWSVVSLQGQDLCCGYFSTCYYWESSSQAGALRRLIGWVPSPQPCRVHIWDSTFSGGLCHLQHWACVYAVSFCLQIISQSFCVLHITYKEVSGVV